MESFRQFLHNSLKLFKQRPIAKPLNICFGNVSCDMDSVVGSLALSYLYYMRQKSQQSLGIPIIETINPFIPIFNCQRDLFPMKLEIIQHLNQCKLIDNDAFPFIFQEDLLQLQIEEINEIGLIDHNKLDISEEHLNSKVTRIIDHHVDNNLYQDTLKEKEIQLIGSAATLVIEKLQTEFSESIDKEMAMFLLAPIVLDSFFFDENLKGSKWTEQDLNAYNYLVKVAEIDNGKEYFDNLYNAISNIELNLHLGINTQLIKDFKTYFVLQEGYKGVGVSSTFVPMRVLLKHFTFEAIFFKFIVFRLITLRLSQFIKNKLTIKYMTPFSLFFWINLHYQLHLI